MTFREHISLSVRVRARRRLRPGVLSLLVVCALTSGTAAAKVTVVASLPDLAALTAEVGGDLVEVTALASARQDPHYVDPRPSFIVQLHRADLVVVNGLELERAWMERLVQQARNNAIRPGSNGYLDCSTLITPLAVPTQRVTRAMGDIHPGGNPHYLQDARAAADVAIGVGARLALVDPEHAAQYQSRAAKVAEGLRAFATAERARFQKLSQKQRRVVTYHLSLTYLWDWLDVTDVAQVEPRPGIAPDPAQVARVLKLMKGQGLGFIAQEDYYPTNVSQTLIKLSGSKTGIVLLEGATRFDEGQRFEDHLRHNTEALHAAMSAQAP